MQYTEEKLKEIERNIISGIDKDLEKERERKELSIEIAKNLIQKGRYKTLYKEKSYTISVAISKVSITILCADDIKYAIASTKYRPFTATMPYDRRTDLLGNVSTVVYSWLAHMDGDIQVVEER